MQLQHNLQKWASNTQSRRLAIARIAVAVAVVNTSRARLRDHIHSCRQCITSSASRRRHIRKERLTEVVERAQHTLRVRELANRVGYVALERNVNDKKESKVKIETNDNRIHPLFITL